MKEEHKASEVILVAIDVAKHKHELLIEHPSGSRRRMSVRNCREDFAVLAQVLRNAGGPCRIGFEATADYHRPIAYFLQKQGFEVCLLSSVAVARTREALHNSWDKNDPKDAQVIIHLMRNGVVTVFHDPVVHGHNDLQELSNVHFQVSRRKTRVQHSIINHYLAIYFPEAEKFFQSSRAHWFGRLMAAFPTPSSVVAHSREGFLEMAKPILSRKQGRSAVLESFYDCAAASIGVPIEAGSEAVAMFRLALDEHLRLCKQREILERTAHEKLKGVEDYQILRSIPGVGPIIALTILAEAGDLRRFGHERQFLKFCGLDLSTQQSGTFRGSSKISKRGNARLRSAFWIACICAIRMRENTFRAKYGRCVKADPTDADRRRRAYTAVTAKIARTAYGLIKNRTKYRAFYDARDAGGRTRSNDAVEAAC